MFGRGKRWDLYTKKRRREKNTRIDGKEKKKEYLYKKREAQHGEEKYNSIVN